MRAFGVLGLAGCVHRNDVTHVGQISVAAGAARIESLGALRDLYARDEHRAIVP